MAKKFSHWVDWDYQSWIRGEYAHTAWSVTPYMEAQWLPDLIFERRMMGGCIRLGWVSWTNSAVQNRSHVSVSVLDSARDRERER